MDDLLVDFVAETREMLEAIGGEIVAWESDPSDTARLDSIFRFVHTVKGNCGFFDFPQLEKLSHAAESALAEVRSGQRKADTPLVNAVLAIVDRIAAMTDLIDAGQEIDAGDDEHLIAALDSDDSDAGESAAMHAADTAAAKSMGQAATARSIRVPVELLDQLMSGASDMVLARNDLARRLRAIGANPELDGPFERLSGILADVREAVTRMRMQRMEYLYNSLPRLVRDLSAELGKQVMVDFEGGDVELDREMMEMIRDPITHIIRNSIDHGIEMPSDRLAAGKREIGMLYFAARQAGNRITISISDDGLGLDIGKLARKAVAANVLSQDDVDQMDRKQLHQLIFEPGLSTADTVNAISGRGVGMDVVRANIEKIGGSIRIRSRPGEGTRLVLDIPLTLSIVAGLTVDVHGQRFAIPHSYVEEIAHGRSAALEFSQVGASNLVTFRGERLPCLALSSVLGMDPEATLAGKTIVFVRLGNGDTYGLGVDRVLDHEDLVVRPLAPPIMASGVYAATTLLDDGNPILMLDIPNIARQNGLVNEIHQSNPVVKMQDQNAAKERREVMLFVGVHGKVSAVDFDLVRRVNRVERDAIHLDGKRAQVVIEGEIIPLIGLEFGDLPEGPITLLHLTDGQSELNCIVNEVLETVEIDADVTPLEGRVGIEGIALVDGKPVQVLDGMQVFSHYARRATAKTSLTCSLPQNDEWARTMLEPLVRSAGYRIATENADNADIAIIIEDEAPDAAAIPSTAAVIRLHSDPDAPTGENDRFYRYDRDGLLGALKSARFRKTS